MYSLEQHVDLHYVYRKIKKSMLSLTTLPYSISLANKVSFCVSILSLSHNSKILCNENPLSYVNIGFILKLINIYTARRWN